MRCQKQTVTASVKKDFAARTISKGAGKGASATSNWDYFMSGKSAQRHSAAGSVPRGTEGGEINSMGRETGIDIFTNYLKSPNYVPLDPTKAHVIFTPN